LQANGSGTISCTNKLLANADLEVTGEADIDNINIDGNTISSSDADGDINLTPNGSGEVNIGNVSVSGTSISSNGALNISAGAGLGLRFNSGGSGIVYTDTDIVPISDSGGIDLGSESLRFTTGYFKDTVDVYGYVKTDEIRELTTDSGVTIDGIKVDGNAITSTATNGDLTLQANGTGKVEVTSADDAPSLRVTGDDPDMDVNINSSSGLNLAEYRMSVDGDAKGHIAYDKSIGAVRIVTYGTNENINLSPDGTGSVVINTDLDVDNINIDGNTISSTDSNGDITLDPNGTGEINFQVTASSGAPTGSSYYIPLSVSGTTYYLELKDAPSGGG